MIKTRALIVFNTGEVVETSKTLEQVIYYAEKHGKKVLVIDRDKSGQPLSAKIWFSSLVVYVIGINEVEVNNAD